MKPNPAGSSPEACKAAGQGRQSCPVCQAWGGVSGLGNLSEPGLGSSVVLEPGSRPDAATGHGPGSGAVLGPEQGPSDVLGLRKGSGAVSGSGQRPSDVLGPRQGSGAVSGPGQRPSDVLEPRQGSGAVPGPGQGPSDVLEPRQGSGAVPGPGQGPSDVLGPRQGSGAVSSPGQGPSDVLGPRQGSGAVSGPGQGPSDVLGPRQGSGAVSSPGQGPSDVLGPRQGSGAVLGPGQGPSAASGAGLVPDSGASPSPGPEVGPGPRRGSGAGQRPSEPMTAPTPAQQQKTQATPVQASRQKIVVTGGAGYLGFSLGSSLAKSGTSVILLDLRRPQWELCPGTEFVQADVRNAEALHRTFEGVDCVFHVASYGMSGAEQLQKEQIESINVGGTKVVIDACVRQRVPRLVYTSTVNVAFGGKPIEQGDEDSVPYFPLEKHTDHYSRTKAIADQLILMANGTPLPGGGSLRTCVLRPPGIYGPEEQRHLPRVASHIKKRLFMFRFGDRRTQMNWVHVRNLVQAHALAAEALTAAKGHVASGQAYYINDGESVNLFEWMAPLFEKLGYSQPWIQVPTSWVYLSATVMEYLHLALRPICSLPPLLTRSEVRSVAVTHTFQIAKARAQLGYVPDKFSFADAVERYVQSTAGRTPGSTARTLLRLLLGLLLFLGLLVLALRFLGLQPSVV